MLKTISPALAALSLVATATPSAAREIERTFEVQIAHADLNLNSAEGLQVLQGRVRAASRDACGKPDARNVHVQREYTLCNRDFDAQVLPQIARLTGKSEVLAMASQDD